MNSWRELFVDNPMLIEAVRYRRRFLSTAKGGAANAGVIGLTSLVYLLLVMTVYVSRDGMEPIHILEFQLFILSFMIPSMLYSSVAGERERRTWDFLMVAPISKAQIIVGKFMSVAYAIVALTILLLIPLIIAWSYHRTPFLLVFYGEAMCFSFSLALSAFCLLVSTLSKRSFAAQAIIYGVLIFELLVWPMLVGIFASFGSSSSWQSIYSFWLYLHPFIGLAWGMEQKSYGTPTVTTFYSWSQLVILLGFATLFLSLAIRHLCHVDDEGVRGRRSNA